LAEACPEHRNAQAHRTSTMRVVVRRNTKCLLRERRRGCMAFYDTVRSIALDKGPGKEGSGEAEEER